MRLKKLITFTLLGALAAGGILALAAFYPALAQAETPTSPEKSSTDRNRPWRFVRGCAFDGDAAEVLAGALGISEDELTAAYETAREAALAQAVEEDLITQAQADALLERGPVNPLSGGRSGWLSQNGIDFEAHLADALGITVDELQEAYQEAYLTRIEQAVEDGSLTREQADFLLGRQALYSSQDFQTSMQSAFQEAVQQAVEDGVITQAQADAILEQQTDGFFFGHHGFGGRRGHGGGFGMHRGRGGPSGVPSGAQTPNPGSGGGQ